MSREYAREVRSAASDPVRLCRGLGLLDGAQRQARGLLIRCPSHGERNPSCSVTRGPDGTVRVRCFACDFSGDALHLVAAVFGFDLESDFHEVMAHACEAVGHHGLADEIRGGEPAVNRPPVSMPEPEPPTDYPPADEIASLWRDSHPVSADPECCAVLVERRIDPVAVMKAKLARAIPKCHLLPRWGVYKSFSWVETGHRLIVRAWDALGAFRSLRSWRVIEGSSPKRLPPAGHRASELVLANRVAVEMLRAETTPGRLLIVEGEPDHLVASLRWPDDAVIGLTSGAWSEAFARRVPSKTEVVILTHHDTAGENYAARVAKTLDGHAVWRATA
jgi:hypothetical protein